MKKRWKKSLHRGFTLLEMMAVLLIISVLVLLFIPNIASQKDKVLATGDTAIVQTIKTELELAKFEKNRELSEEEIKDLLDGPDSRKYQIYLKEVKKE